MSFLKGYENSQRKGFVYASLVRASLGKVRIANSLYLFQTLSTLSSQHFYRDLKALSLPIAEVFHEKYFCDVPPDWCVIIADIQNSSAAVADGRHNDVNLVAAGSLIASINIAKQNDVEIPFFFGGDGGVVLVPGNLADEVVTALLLHNENSLKNFGLGMHIGSLSVNDIVQHGAGVKIAKIELGQSFNKAVLIGNGLKFAEQQIKGASRTARSETISTSVLNMAGLECRWDKIKPPEEENEIVCYLIEARDEAAQTDVYREVLQKIDEIYGSVSSRSPLSVNRLKLLLNLKKIRREMMARFGRWKIRYYLNVLLENFLGLFYFGFNMRIGKMSGHDYLTQLIVNADTLTIDGRINTIISGKTEKRKQLLAYLTQKESEGRLSFGHHISRESVMTCYIENLNARHIHFVDGSDGGYTEAAKELKAKTTASRA